MENRYKIYFNLSDLSFEVESTDLEWLNSKTKDLFEKIEALKSEIGGARINNMTPQDMFTNNTADVGKMEQLSVTEFFQTQIKKNSITSRNRIALFFVYYLEKAQKKTDIKTADIANCFRDIGYPNYSQINFTDILHQNRRQGLLNNVNSYWTLTMTGLDLILNVITGAGRE